jgi:sarcosine oxidase
MGKSYDFVVVGAGVFGAWTAYHLRRRRFRVALLDGYGPANSRASSGGETRIIRMGYGADELYTRWAARAMPQWRELEIRTKQTLFQKTGVLWLSGDDDPYTAQILKLLPQEGINCDELSAADLQKRYPQLSLENVQRGILEPDSGVLMARQAVQALVNESAAAGVEHFRSCVVPYSKASKLEAIETTAGEIFFAGSFIFACGSWLPKLFPELLRDRIRSTRQEVFFLGVPPGVDIFSMPKMPAWLHNNHPDRPYVLPDISNRGVKIAFDRHGPDFDPDAGVRTVTPEAISALRKYLKPNVPLLKDAPIVETRVCQYENTWNGDFLIDRHPALEKVWLIAGGSGHGFKHGPVVGQYVCDMLLGNPNPESRFSLATKQTTRLRAVF